MRRAASRQSQHGNAHTTGTAQSPTTAKRQQHRPPCSHLANDKPQQGKIKRKISLITVYVQAIFLPFFAKSTRFSVILKGDIVFCANLE
jgi:hypothetical protein